MTKELTQLERAMRFVERTMATPLEDMEGDPECEESLKDSQALVAQFQRLYAKELNQIEAGRKYGHLGASHGHKGGRPKLKNPSTPAPPKRNRKPKQTNT